MSSLNPKAQGHGLKLVEDPKRVGSVEDAPLVAEFELPPISQSAKALAGERISLKASEIVCLMVAALLRDEDKPFTYADAIDFSHEHMPKPFAEGTVFNAVAALSTLGFLERRAKQSTRAGRPREVFAITNRGLGALHLALSLAMQIAEGHQQEAA